MLQYQSSLLHKSIIFSKSHFNTLILNKISQNMKLAICDRQYTQQLLSHNTAQQNQKFYKNVTSANASP